LRTRNIRFSIEPLIL